MEASISDAPPIFYGKNDTHFLQYLLMEKKCSGYKNIEQENIIFVFMAKMITHFLQYLLMEKKCSGYKNIEQENIIV